MTAHSEAQFCGNGYEVPAPKHMFLRVLAAQMGVGGDDSWMSPVHPQYHIPADKPLHLDVDIELI